VEYVFAIMVFAVSMFVFYMASKNSYRSKIMKDYDKSCNLAKEALERGNWNDHLKHKRKSEEIYAMLRRCDYVDRNTHWRL
jgi:uncharacterized membrane protein|tara:strand:+ start:99 stop:341 length:243 start_codon:yes stop_codon:yes gene_type:complete